MTDRAVRVAGLAALVFVVLILIGALAPGNPPAGDASVDKIRMFMTDHRGAILLATLLGLFATPFAVWFFVTLRELTRGDGISNMAGTSMLAGIIFTGCMALVGGAVFAAPLYLDGFTEGATDDTVRIVYSMQFLVFESTVAGLLLVLGGAFVVIRRTRALPMAAAWVAALGFVLAVVAAFATLSAGSGALGFLGLVGLVLFMVVAGIMMLAGKVKTPVPVA